MLVLSRKKNESIVINNDITIVVVEIRGDKVRLGVEAPREVPVHRREVFENRFLSRIASELVCRFVLVIWMETSWSISRSRGKAARVFC